MALSAIGETCLIARGGRVLRAYKVSQGAYKNAAGALRLTRTWGDFLTMWKVHMALAGFNETRVPAVSDVGAVRGGNEAIVAAIRVPSAWVGKAPRGLTHEDMPALFAWSLTHG